MRRLISIVLTLLVILGVNYATAHYTNSKFIDFSFLVGLAFSIIIWFFTSKGGVSSQYTNVLIQEQTTNFKMAKEKYEFSPNVVFLTALVYTIVSIIVTIIYYRS